MVADIGVHGGRPYQRGNSSARNKETYGERFGKDSLRWKIKRESKNMEASKGKFEEATKSKKMGKVQARKD